MRYVCKKEEEEVRCVLVVKKKIQVRVMLAVSFILWFDLLHVSSCQTEKEKFFFNVIVDCVLYGELSLTKSDYYFWL